MHFAAQCFPSACRCFVRARLGVSMRRMLPAPPGRGFRELFGCRTARMREHRLLSRAFKSGGSSRAAKNSAERKDAAAARARRMAGRSVARLSSRRRRQARDRRARGAMCGGVWVVALERRIVVRRRAEKVRRARLPRGCEYAGKAGRLARARGHGAATHVRAAATHSAGTSSIRKSTTAARRLFRQDHGGTGG